jgi:two-component system, NarL family, nitrate/nitrite response regulator NarL
MHLGETDLSGIGERAQPPMRLLSADNVFCFALARLLGDIAGELAVTTARSLEHMHELAAAGASFDLVLLDLGSDGAGSSGVERLLELMPEARVIVTSSSADTGDVLAAIRAGARGVIPVSSRQDLLRHALALILAGEFYFPASVLRAGFAGEPRPAQIPRPVAAASRPIADFSPRQTEVLLKLAAGMSNKAIARDLRLIDGTVKLHVKAILRKLGVANRTQAVMAAARAGYLPSAFTS